MRKYIIFGILGGIFSAFLTILFFLISDFVRVNPLGALKAFSYLPAILMIFVSLWYFRSKVLLNEMHFHQAFFLAFLVNLIGCLFYSLFIYLYMEFWNPAFLLAHIAESKKLLFFVKDSLQPDQYKLAMKVIDYYTSWDITQHDLKWRFFIQLFFVFIASFIMRKTPEWAKSK